MNEYRLKTQENRPHEFQKMRHQKTISKMTLEQKIAFCSGKSFWETKEFKELGIPSLFLSDGPHGLRKQEGNSDHLGLNASRATTCFPTASAVSAAWDNELIYRMGEAIGKEAAKIGVNVVLGPGTNMKRNPLCGRNFEYFSEDPFLSGSLSTVWIKGCQSTGAGVSLKHFALNNQELKRMSTDVLVDERALREYYLSPFEAAVKEGKPTTVMCAYNKVEGTYCSDNKMLLQDILRKEWRFDGAVITDWGAMNDRIKAFKAGLDLEMPGSNGRFDQEVKSAVEQGILMEKTIDDSVDRLLTLIERTTDQMEVSSDEIFNEHHQLAREIAQASGVLLKNEGQLLPLQKGAEIAVIGKLAETPRYQGSGSSQVTPTKLVSLLEAIRSYSDEVTYEQGYTIEDKVEKNLQENAVKLAKSAEVAVVCMGLTDIFESEGFDRLHMRIPHNQIQLLNEISKVQENVVIVLVGGSAIEMPWENKGKSILHMQLSGQAGGQATADLLFGAVNPSGKLTESYPYTYEDVVNSSYYLVNPKQTPYLESMFCGYRYFTTAGTKVRYPFGFGLSYTTFDYLNMNVHLEENGDVTVSATILNSGKVAGAEVVQVYVSPETGGVYRPKRELKSFMKVHLQPIERKEITLKLTKRDFAIYDSKRSDWIVERGIYVIELGSSCEDIRLKDPVTLEGEEPIKSQCSGWYYTFDEDPSKEDFLTIHKDFEEYVPQTKGTYDITSSLKEMKETSRLCRMIFKGLEKGLAKQTGGKVDYLNPEFKMLMDSASDLPVKAMPLFSSKISIGFVQFIVETANGHPFRGLKHLLKKRS
ncbi:glycoside hydrolase family 3 C-terminal domain-containing protein [Evansella sp. AB-P1]|uniref:beta-glucosidase n=1 Tax=Evansella sp. AB-P1 TaxID=3037653 RepID=UPI00242025F8|nr:glycoside hydrolase family 3 C-terminal domain-containing protein [Evansella sp. AB-P1]MDG5789748.1 glycoside hydrolase family 3 C-terminal domain-containing protein [Evansella sp. AB-P1]